MSGLRPEQGPPLAVPSGFFLTAPLALVAAGALLLVGGGQGVESVWSGPNVALVHLGTVALWRFPTSSSRARCSAVSVETLAASPRAASARDAIVSHRSRSATAPLSRYCTPEVISRSAAVITRCVPSNSCSAEVSASTLPALLARSAPTARSAIAATSATVTPNPNASRPRMVPSARGRSQLGSAAARRRSRVGSVNAMPVIVRPSRSRRACRPRRSGRRRRSDR
jgi:hypothetical protein